MRPHLCRFHKAIIPSNSVDLSRYIKDMALPLGSPLPARNWKWRSIFKTISSYIFFVLNVLWHIRCYVGLEPMGLFWPPWNTKLPYILKSRKLFRSWPFNHKYSCVLYYYASNGIKFMAPGIFFYTLIWIRKYI